MTKAEIITQVRIWAKESDSTSELTDSQIYSWVDSGIRLWMVRILEWCGMAGFKGYTEESLTVDSDGKSVEFTDDPFLIIEATIDQNNGYRSMKRQEGTYEGDDDRIVNSSTNRPTYRLIPTSTPGWKIEVAPAVSGTAKVRFIEDPGPFANANVTIPTVLNTSAEQGLACYIAGTYNENNGNEQNAIRCYAKAEEYMKMIPRGFRG